MSVTLNRTNDPALRLGGGDSILVAREERSDASLVSIHVAFNAEAEGAAQEALEGLSQALLDVLLTIRSEEAKRRAESVEG